MQTLLFDTFFKNKNVFEKKFNGRWLGSKCYALFFQVYFFKVRCNRPIVNTCEKMGLKSFYTLTTVRYLVGIFRRIDKSLLFTEINNYGQVVNYVFQSGHCSEGFLWCETWPPFSVRYIPTRQMKKKTRFYQKLHIWRPPWLLMSVPILWSIHDEVNI